MGTPSFFIQGMHIIILKNVFFYGGGGRKWVVCIVMFNFPAIVTKLDNNCFALVYTSQKRIKMYNNYMLWLSDFEKWS